MDILFCIKIICFIGLVFIMNIFKELIVEFLKLASGKSVEYKKNPLFAEKDLNLLQRTETDDLFILRSLAMVLVALFPLLMEGVHFEESTLEGVKKFLAIVIILGMFLIITKLQCTRR